MGLISFQRFQQFLRHKQVDLRQSNDRLPRAQQQALARADLNGDHFVGGRREVNRAFRELKGLDATPDPNALDVGTGEQRTAVGRAWQAIKGLAQRTPNLNTVKGCAQFLLHSPNVSFWSGLSTGSDRRNLARLARGDRAHAITGARVKPPLRVMRALVEMAKRGPIQINALTGGRHSTGSNHYRGHAVDLDIRVGNAREIEAIARRFGGSRNSERTHIHLDF